MKSPKKAAQKLRKIPTPRSVIHRLRSVRRVLRGLSAVKVGWMYGDSPRAVAYWVTRFKAHGARGLEVLPRSGRPSKINSEQMKKLKTFVIKSRAKSQRVSGGVLATFIKKAFGVTLTSRQCGRILKRMSA